MKKSIRENGSNIKSIESRVGRAVLSLSAVLVLLGVFLSSNNANAHFVPAEVPYQPLQIGWYGVVDDQVILDERLTVEISSSFSETVTVTAEIRCSGLISKSETMRLGSFVVQPGETIYADVFADELPIQSETSVNQLTAYAYVEPDDPQGRVSGFIATAPIYYQHVFDFAELAVYTRRSFLTLLRGHLTQRVDVEQGSNERIGWILGNDNQFDEVFRDDSDFAHFDGDRLVGWTTGRHVGKNPFARWVDDDREENEPITVKFFQGDLPGIPVDYLPPWLDFDIDPPQGTTS